MPTQVDAAIAEIKSSQAELEPEYEGLLDYARLNILDPTREEVAKSSEEYARRLNYLSTALAALEALAADGHPVIPVRELSSEAYVDLQYNSTTIQAALEKFKAGLANSIAFSAGPVEPK